MAVLEDARDRAVDGAAEGEAVTVEISEGRDGMLADRDAVFVGFQDDLTDEELTALVAAVESSTDLFGDRVSRLVELGELVGTARTDAEAAFAAAQGAEGSFAGALALLESLVPQIDQGNTSILGYQQIAQAALAAVQALYATTPSAEIDSTLAETLFELAAIAERAAQSAAFLEQAEEQLATSQSYAERLAIGRAIELQQQAIDADLQMQQLLEAADALVAESDQAQLAFVELDRAIDAMVLSRSNAVASRTAAADAQGAIGTLFGNHALAVDVAKNHISWQSGVDAAEAGRIAAEGFQATAEFNRDAAVASYAAVLALAAAQNYEQAYQESLQTAGFALNANVAAAGAAGAASDAVAGSDLAVSAGGQLINLLNSPEELAAYEADAAAALAAAGSRPSEADPDGEGALGAAGVAIDQAAAALEQAQSAQADAVEAVGAYGGLGGDVLQPNNALIVLAGQIQEAIDQLEAASAQYTQLQAYAQTWASRIAIENVQAGITAALANAGAAVTAAELAQQAANEAQQAADDAATAAVPPGDGQP